jgi:hypothetical protein
LRLRQSLRTRKKSGNRCPARASILRIGSSGRGRQTGCKDAMQTKVTKAIFPVAGFRHALSSGDQVDSQGDAAPGRPPADPVRDRRGPRRRDHRLHLRHLPRQERARGLFRPCARARDGSLAENGKQALLETLQQTVMGSGAVAYVRQHERLGLGHAVWCARHLIGDEPFAVILPDDVIDAETPVPPADGRRLRRVRRQHGRDHGGRAGPGLGLRHPRRRRRARAHLLGPGHGREAGAGGCALEPRDHRPLHPAPSVLGHLDAEARGRRRDPADRRDRQGDHRGRPVYAYRFSGPALRLRLEGGLPAGDGRLRPPARPTRRGIRRLSRGRHGRARTGQRQAAKPPPRPASPRAELRRAGASQAACSALPSVRMA